MKRYATAAAMLAALMMVSSAHAATAVNWTGVAGAQWDLGNNFNGAPALTTLGATNGWSTGVLADPVITLDGPIAVGVVYDAEFNGDFRLNSGPGGTGELVISGGATLELQSGATTDGKWTEVDAKGITVTGAGSVLSRTTTVPANNAGAWIFGSWRNDPGEKMDLAVLDGGTVDNAGQMWFGAWDDSAPNLDITWTVGYKAAINTHDYLPTVGSALGQPGPDPEAAINFIYNYDAGTGTTATNAYDIDLVAHGAKVTVGTGQIKIQEKSGPLISDWATTIATYQDLYAAGRLLSSGSNAAAFGDKFFVQGNTGDAVYEVRSIEGANVSGGANAGDINGDYLTNAADAGTMFTHWSTGTHGGHAHTVSEGELTGGVGAGTIDAADAGLMFANWTTSHNIPDPGPAAPGTAVADYDPTTGEIVVSIDGVNNWFVESASASLTGVPFSITPIVAGSLASDSDTLIGETGFGVATGTDVSLGNVAALGLLPGDLTISWNAGLGTPVQTILVNVIPEPASLALAVFGLCGVLATRRRRVA